MWWHSEKAAIFKPARGSSSEPTMLAPDFGLSASRLWEDKFHLCQSVVFCHGSLSKLKHFPSRFGLCREVWWYALVDSLFQVVGSLAATSRQWSWRLQWTGSHGLFSNLGGILPVSFPFYHVDSYLTPAKKTRSEEYNFFLKRFLYMFKKCKATQ